MAYPVLIDGKWRDASAKATFQASDPQAAAPIDGEYPISDWADCDAALEAAQAAFAALRDLPGEQIAKFLECFATRIEERSDEICALAALETALPLSPRLAGVELPRTCNQLRQAAEAARTGSWRMATIDTASNIRSCYAAIGPVAVFGPNNFPLAFGSISGGDFAAAIAAGNPVIAKANSAHPGTTRLLAEEAQAAAEATGMPSGTVQLLYRTEHSDGERLVADPRLGAVGYTGARHAGLKLKAAADAVGKPIYLELSSVNPLFVLPGALQERGADIATQLSGSCLLGTGQFCTSPGIVILVESPGADEFVASVADQFQAAAVGTLLSAAGREGLGRAVESLQAAGAQVVCGGKTGGGQGYSYANTLLRVSGSDFLANSHELQTEAFGNACLMVIAQSVQQAAAIAAAMEGNLTGCIFSATDSQDDGAYRPIAAALRQRVGRLLNDKMPTGVAVTAAMNHGGPFPATGHPGFTAVGLPGSMLRFAMLQCFDNVRPHRLPAALQDANATGAWRLIDGEWTKGEVTVLS
jgi:NADP-dependent aldehyde dehydrogenase